MVKGTWSTDCNGYVADWIGVAYPFGPFSSQLFKMEIEKEWVIKALEFNFYLKEK